MGLFGPLLTGIGPFGHVQALQNQSMNLPLEYKTNPVVENIASKSIKMTIMIKIQTYVGNILVYIKLLEFFYSLSFHGILVVVIT